jgi:hypothetical protein
MRAEIARRTKLNGQRNRSRMGEDNERPKSDLQTVRSAAMLDGELVADIRALIEAARLRVAQTVNSELVLLNWQSGARRFSAGLDPLQFERQRTNRTHATESRRNPRRRILDGTAGKERACCQAA